MTTSLGYSGEVQALDFFSGLGIMSYGLKKEGLSVSMGMEIDPERTRLYRLNLEVNAREIDLSIATKGSIRSIIGSEKLKPELVVG